VVVKEPTSTGSGITEVGCHAFFSPLSTFLALKRVGYLFSAGWTKRVFKKTRARTQAVFWNRDVQHRWWVLQPLMHSASQRRNAQEMIEWGELSRCQVRKNLSPDRHYFLTLTNITSLVSILPIRSSFIATLFQSTVIRTEYYLGYQFTVLRHYNRIHVFQFSPMTLRWQVDMNSYPIQYTLKKNSGRIENGWQYGYLHGWLNWDRKYFLYWSL